MHGELVYLVTNLLLLFVEVVHCNATCKQMDTPTSTARKEGFTSAW